MSSDKDLLDLMTSMLKFESKGISASEFARALVHNVLSKLDAQTALVCQLDFDSNIRFVGRYGFDSKSFHGEQTLSVWDDCVIPKALREQQIVVIGNRQDFESDFTSGFSGGWPGESFVAIPLIRDGQAIGAIGISFSSNLCPEVTDLQYWQTLQLVAEAHFLSVWKKGSNSPAASMSFTEPEALSERQLRILNLLSAGKTNREIANELILSESSIKQETMRIFAALGVANRKQAAAQAANFGLVTIKQ